MKKIILESELEGYCYLDDGYILLSDTDDRFDETEYAIKNTETDEYQYHNINTGETAPLNNFIDFHVLNKYPMYILSNLKEFSKFSMIKELSR